MMHRHPAPPRAEYEMQRARMRQWIVENYLDVTYSMLDAMEANAAHLCERRRRGEDATPNELAMHDEYKALRNAYCLAMQSTEYLNDDDEEPTAPAHWDIAAWHFTCAALMVIGGWVVALCRLPWRLVVARRGR